jgi:replication initiation protein RepC
MSITLTHGGLPTGIGRFALFDAFDAVARTTFGISETAIRLMKHYISKCRDSDFLAGRICGTWEQPFQTATSLGISTRVLNNAERELMSAGFLHRSATPHVRRDGRRIGDRIVAAAGINLGPVIDRHLELAELGRAQELHAEALVQLRREIADIRSQIRVSENLAFVEQAETILPRGRTSRIIKIEKLEAIKADLEALLVCLELPSGEQKSSDRTEETFSPNILQKDSSKNCSDAREPRSERNEATAVSPAMVARLASEDYQALLEAKGGPTVPNLIETSATACHWLGISLEVWGEACQQMGRERAALCVLIIDRNRRLPTNHRYYRKFASASLEGMVRKGANNLNVIGLLRAIEGYPEGLDGNAAPSPQSSQPYHQKGVHAVGRFVPALMAKMQIVTEESKPC